MKNSLPLLALYVYIVNENFFCTTFHHITASLLDALLWGRNWSALWAWKAEAQDAYLHFSLLLGKRMRLIAAPTQPTNLTSCIMNMQLVRPCDNNTKWATWASVQIWLPFVPSLLYLLSPFLHLLRPLRKDVATEDLMPLIAILLIRKGKEKATV